MKRKNSIAMRTKFCLFLIAFTVLAIAKTRDWKTGKLISVDVDQRNLINYIYKIDDGKIIWVANRNAWSKYDKALLVTVNAEVKFAVEGDHLFLVDEKGKEHKLDIQHKILKE